MRVKICIVRRDTRRSMAITNPQQKQKKSACSWKLSNLPCCLHISCNLAGLNGRGYGIPTKLGWSVVVGSLLRIRGLCVMCYGTTGGGCTASAQSFSPQMISKWIVSLKKGWWSPQSSGCYRLRRRWGTRVGDAQRHQGIPVRLSPEYPTGTHGALLDQFSTRLKLLPIL